MPNIPQSELPKPKSWDEFEDIVWDLYARRWEDPYADRYGRAGQRQHGVDICGRPMRLGGRCAGVQCKRYAEGTLTQGKIEAEVAKAETFTPPLAEYIIATTDVRDVDLQSYVLQLSAEHEAAGNFKVSIAFWDTLCGLLTHPDYRDILQKHYADWLVPDGSSSQTSRTLNPSDGPSIERSRFMSPIRWLVFILVLLVTPVIFIGILAGVGWISLSLSYSTLGSILAAYLGWATFLHWAKFRELLQDFGIPRARAGEKSFRFSHRYRQHLIHRHRFFDVKGLSTQGIFTLELKRVFVELVIAPRPAHETTADPIHTLPEGALRGQTIWSYLNLEALTQQDLVVIGPPGCGKTTLLKHMVLALIAGRRQRRRWRAPDKLPVLLFLRDHTQAVLEDPNLSLPQVVCNDLARWHLCVPLGWFESRLERGRCLVLLDGLDEVADPEVRQQVVAWVQRQMEAYGSNRFVITSRPYGYRQHCLSGVSVLQVSPFTRDQVERFVHNWYTANEIMSAQKDDLGVRQDAAKGASDLLQRLRNTPDLADLAVNPLLLTMIATVHRYRSSLPGRRVELYKEICDVFLGQRRQARGLALDLTPAQKQQILQPLAYYLMCQKRREASLEEAVSVIADPLARVSPALAAEILLKKVEDESGLLLERESGIYVFAHKTFQEFLASAHALNQNLEAELAQRVGEGWWHETIRLYTAQTDASPIVEACLAGDPPSIQALILAIGCREEALELEPALRIQLEKILAEGVEDPDPERHRPVAEALLALRLRRMIRVDEDCHLDNSLVIHAEYQLFLDEKRTQGEYYQPDHWPGHRFAAGQGRMPVVGMRPADAVAFCEWLTGREAGEWNYRLPRVGESRRDPIEHAEATAHWSQTGQAFECIPPSERYVLLGKQLEQRVADDLSFILESDRTLARDLELGLALARDRAAARDLGLVRALVRDRTPPADGSYNPAVALDRALALDQALVDALARALDRARNRAPILECARARVLVRVLDRARFRGQGGYARHSNIGLERNLYRELARDLGDILDRAQDRGRGADLRQGVRSNQLVLVGRLLLYLVAQAKPWTARLLPGGGVDSYEAEVKRISDGCLDLYVDLCILEARIAGELPAFEGIRLLRER